LILTYKSPPLPSSSSRRRRGGEGRRGERNKGAM